RACEREQPNDQSEAHSAPVYYGSLRTLDGSGGMPQPSPRPGVAARCTLLPWGRRSDSSRRAGCSAACPDRGFRVFFRGANRGLDLATNSRCWSIPMIDYPDVFIVGAARTPIGKFLGGLATLKASDLGAIAIRSAMER